MILNLASVVSGPVTGFHVYTVFTAGFVLADTPVAIASSYPSSPPSLDRSIFTVRTEVKLVAVVYAAACAAFCTPVRLSQLAKSVG